MMKVPDVLFVFSLYLFKLHLLLGCKKGRDFGVRLGNTIQDALHRRMVNRFHIAARALDQGSYFRRLLIA